MVARSAGRLTGYAGGSAVKPYHPGITRGRGFIEFNLLGRYVGLAWR